MSPEISNEIPQTVEAEDMIRDLFNTDEDQRQEPEARFEEDVVREAIGERTDETRVTARGQRNENVPSADERIAYLERANRALESQINAERSVSRVIAERTAPRPQNNIEWVDTPWGIQIPKDPRQRAVQLSGEHLKLLGMDPEIAEPLNILANAFWAQIVNTIPGATLRAMDQVQDLRGRAQNRTSSFFTAYPDLVDHADFVQTVEHNARRSENLHHRHGSIDSYNEDLAMRVRSRVAAMRGQSLDDYMSGLGVENARNRNNSRVVERPVSRARSVGGGRTNGSSRVGNGGDPVLDDMLNNS